MNKAGRAAAVFSAAATLFFSCSDFDGTIRNASRDITVDIDNSLFLEPDAVNVWEQGPGVNEVNVTFVLDSGEVSAGLSAADAEAGSYTQIVQEVSGVLERVDVKAATAAGSLITASIDESAEHEQFHGWQIFANLQRFRLAYNGNTDDNWASGYLTLDIAPNGGTGIRFLIDSGVTASMSTDWGGDSLTSKQIAVEPILSENPAGLSFDIYTLIVDEDLRERYKPGYSNTDADYEHYPWADVWSYEELTSTGKQIGGAVYRMGKYNGGSPLDFIEPSGDGSGYDAFLIDLSDETDNPVGKYLMFALVSHYDVLSVTSRVEIIEIR